MFGEKKVLWYNDIDVVNIFVVRLSVILIEVIGFDIRNCFIIVVFLVGGIE